MDVLYLDPRKMRIVNGYKNEDAYGRYREFIKKCLKLMRRKHNPK